MCEADVCDFWPVHRVFTRVVAPAGGVDGLGVSCKTSSSFPSPSAFFAKKLAACLYCYAALLFRRLDVTTFVRTTSGELAIRHALLPVVDGKVLRRGDNG